MAATKHRGKAREEHLAEVARLYLAGTPQHEIAAARKVAPSQITYDLRILRDRWRAQASVDFDLAVGLQLARLDRFEAELWQAWHTSKLRRSGPNAAIMGQLLGVCQERSKLLGLYPAEKRDVMVSSGGGISLDLLQKIRERKERAEAAESGVPLSLIRSLRDDDEIPQA